LGVAERQRFSSGSSFERDIGYSRFVVDGDDAFVSGTTGFDYAAMTISESSFANVVRVRCIVRDVADFEPCGPTLRTFFGQALPAATMICAGLYRPAHEDRNRSHGASR
jgi:enamine deaminase RidA (YjgF/YER057c/UK114 family)